MMKFKIENICVESSISVLEALKYMDRLKRKLLIVTENKKFKSLLSIGDIQRTIIANIPLESSIDRILRSEVKVASENDDIDQVKAFMRERRNEFMPIIDDEKNIIDVIFWEDLFQHKISEPKEKFNLPIIIMAGGKGTRLRPLTNVLPKSLIPIGEQTIVEDIMDRFIVYGSNYFYLSVNYKAEVIKRFFDNKPHKHYSISYFQEDRPLGTAGSLNLLKEIINTTFFVSNCDIIIDEDYGEILRYHRENDNEITVVAAIKSISIPYGTMMTGENGQLKALVEKPEHILKINTGMYILEPHLLKEIPSDRVFHITDLIEKLTNENRKVGVFPINEGSWIDIGSWEEYIRCIGKNEIKE